MMSKKNIKNPEIPLVKRPKMDKTNKNIPVNFICNHGSGIKKTGILKSEKMKAAKYINGLQIIKKILIN